MNDRSSYRYEGAAHDHETNALVLAGNPAARDKAIEAVGQAGGRVLATLDWQSAAAALGDHAVLDVLMIEAEGADDDALDAVLPRIDTLARATEARVVIALADHQIDLVAAHLLDDHAQLLCAPSVTERVIALTLARSRPTALNDAGREAETERLRRLNDEVARIADTLARLTRRESDASSQGRPSDLFADRRPTYGAPPGAAADTVIDPHDIRQAIRARRLRDQFFDQGLFEDPAWDMLLDLYAAELERGRVSVSSLCIASAVAPTTALRWIGKMSEAGLFERQPDPFDRRRAFMALSDKARDGMRHYCAAVKKLGLAIA